MKVCLVDGGSSYRELFLRQKSSSVLASYYHIRKSSFHFFQNNDFFILDSGAFTFMNSKKTVSVDWDSYIEEYASFINKHDIKYFFELDIDVLVGISEVERLRSKLEKLTGKKSIPVWHISRGIDYFKKMVDTYEYIAIGGLVTKEIVPTDYGKIKKMVDYANSHNVKVHGLGFTSMKWLKHIRWFSVDSTSWLGTIFSYRYYKYLNGEMKATQIKGLDNSKYKDLVFHNYKQWILFQKYAEEKL